VQVGRNEIAVGPANAALVVSGGISAPAAVAVAIVNLAATDAGAVAPLGTTAPMPLGRRRHATASWQDLTWLIGGEIELLDGGANQYSSEVLVSSMQADGGMAPWAQTTPLPAGAQFLGAAVVQGTLVVTGGFRGAVLAEV
jgi:hypothetical protein